MELLQDGVVAALAAIGVTALIWLAASLLLWRERPVDAVYLVRVSGDGTGLDVTLRRLAQSRRLPVLLVDCGLNPEERARMDRLIRDRVGVSCCLEAELPERLKMEAEKFGGFGTAAGDCGGGGVPKC